MDSVRNSFARAGLVRSRDSKLLGGVCAGLGRRLGIDPVPARWLFVVALLVIPGSQLLVYPALWFCMPIEGAYAQGPVAEGPVAA
jgi:phage shock protein PspC (stress-responsive transcriptional regulator)